TMVELSLPPKGTFRYMQDVWRGTFLYSSLFEDKCSHVGDIITPRVSKWLLEEKELLVSHLEQGVMEELMARHPSDGLSMWHCGSHGESNRRQVCDRPSRGASCLGSIAPRVLVRAIDRRVCDGPSLPPLRHSVMQSSPFFQD
ncbi:hypothetical protein HAX54_005725, partial [Datura stramonium]|nr:hypothetical protein [Datura stramonium]